LIRIIFSGSILPLLSLTSLTYLYSLDIEYNLKLIYGSILISIIEILSLFLVYKLNNDKKINFKLNKGILYGTLIFIIMTIYPPLSKSELNLLPFTSILVSAIISGVCEEVIYRGFLTVNIRSIFIQAILWGTLHVFQGYLFFLWTILIGTLLGFISYKYGVLPCLIAHVSSNVIRLVISTFLYY